MIKLIFIIFNLMGMMTMHIDADKITVEQRFPENINSGESFVVELDIKKGDYNGFAKWQQSFPTGFKVEMMETRGGTFSFKDEVLKLIWLELPSEESFKVSYRVVSDSTLIMKPYEFKGKYSYVQNNGKIDVYSNRETLVVSERLNSSATQQPAEDMDKSAFKRENSLTIIDFDSPQKIKNKPGHSISPVSKVTFSYVNKTSQSEKANITYRIQVAAGHSKLDQKHFHQYFNIEDFVFTELHNGWNKYTVGSFQDYQSARNNRNLLWAKQPAATGAFVTAYIGNKRISVTEALKISKEQWVN